jgi:hypothetical protein
MTTYQAHNKISHSTNAIAERKNYSEKLAQMRAEGTYCDNEDPDLSFLNFRASCRQCPNYKECKETSEERSSKILKYRRKTSKKSKTKRKTKGGK